MSHEVFNLLNYKGVILAADDLPNKQQLIINFYHKGLYLMSMVGFVVCWQLMHISGKVTIELNGNCNCLIIKLSQILAISESDNQISFIIDKEYYSQCRVNLISEQLVTDSLQLIQCNWRDKSHTLQSNSPIFEKNGYEYAPGFIRGVSDGDGS
eukprot:55694_1